MLWPPIITNGKGCPYSTILDANRAGAYATSMIRQKSDMLETGWLLVAALAPLWINLWARQPFDLNKVLMFRSLVWIMFGVWGITFLSSRCLSWQQLWRSLRHRLHQNPLLWPLLLVAVTQILATAFAIDQTLSFFGSYERSQGLLTLLSYLLLFLMVSNRLRSHAQAWRLLGTLLLTALPLILIGLAQSAGWDPFGLHTNARSNIYATLGRANFVGAYLAMLVPLCLAFLQRAKTVGMRLLSGLLLLLILCIIGLTKARSAWLAAAISLATFGLLFYWATISPTLRRVIVGILILGGVAAIVGTFWIERGAGSTAARLTIWRATANLIAREPIWGYGPESLGLIFPRVFPPELVYYQGRDVFVDRAHNFLLEWTVSSGVVGLLAWLWLFVAYFRAAWRSIKQAAMPDPQSDQRTLLIAPVAAISGGIVGNLFSFDVTATATTTWLLMAMTVALGRSDQRERLTPITESQSQRVRSANVRRILTIVFLAGIGFAEVEWNLRPFVADLPARRADQHSAIGDWRGAIGYAERAVAWWPKEPEYLKILGKAYLRSAQAPEGNAAADLQRGDATYAALVTLRPDDYRSWAEAGEFYGAWAINFDAQQLSRAHQAFEQAVALAPTRARLQTAWGEIDLASGNLDDAATKFRRAVDLDATDGYSFWRLGQTELARNQPHAALTAFQESVHWEPDLVAPRIGLARAYLALGQEKEALQTLDDALLLDPLDPIARQLHAAIKDPP